MDAGNRSDKLMLTRGRICIVGEEFVASLEGILHTLHPIMQFRNKILSAIVSDFNKVN